MEKTNIGEPITIAFFKAPTAQGAELYKMFQRTMEEYSLRGHPVHLAEQTTYKMMPAIMACLDSDVVIFDGSIEDDKNEQYRAAIELMKCLDHVLIVSRTLLPFNFKGMRQGGAPGFIKTGTLKYRDRMSNEEILEWLLDTLEHSTMELPRKLKLNLPEKEYKRNLQLVQRVEGRMITESDNRIEKESGVFVSYLSRYSRFYEGMRPEEPCVEELFESISKISRVSMNDIRYFPPGKISLEFMTAQRRFEIASMTEAFIAGCKAFWIYETPDYDSSWWAYGERISLLHIFGNAMEKCPDIYVVKPLRDETGKWKFDLKKYVTPEEKKAFLPELTAYQEREMERLYINSNPETVGYEQVEKMRNLAKMPTPLLKLQLKVEAPFVAKRFQMLFNSIDMSEQERQEAIKEVQNIDGQIESILSYVYTKEFWDNHIVECPVCKAASEKGMNPEKYMHFKAKYFYPIDLKEYREIIKKVKQGERCNVKLHCGHTVSVKQSGTYYRWWTVKNNIPTGPNGKLLEEVNFISFC